MDDLARTAEFLKIIGQETRVRILDSLREGERCVCEIWPGIGEQSNVSRHLAVLVKNGILAQRRQGTRQYYRVVWPAVFRVLDAARDVRCCA